MTLKNISSILIILFLCTNFLPAQEKMIADIDYNIETEFGTYAPYPVEISPHAKSYHVEADLSNVVNSAAFSFNAEEKRLLTSNSFVVSRDRDMNKTGYNDIFDIYNECRELGIPIFVTTDAMLHTFHLCFDFILQTVEQKKFIPDLDALLKQMIDVTGQQQALTTDAAVQEALTTNINFLYVAESLLDSTYTPPNPSHAYFDELLLIQNAKDWIQSPLFEYEEDYTQYIPRGHYTKSDSLRHYFLSMMWLGRMTYAADQRFTDLSRRKTRSAILLVQAMLKSEIGIESGLNVWNRIYDPTVFFVGRSDDINFDQYIKIAEEVYGTTFADRMPDDFADETLLDQFLTKSYSLEGPKITYEGQPKGFRFMGQRFTPDSWVFDELVMTKVPSRTMPKGLDVMAVLGSERADFLLEDMGEKALFPGYAAKLDVMKQTFRDYPAEIWAQNLYWNWLYSLMPLLFPKGNGFPPFMQNIAWTDKELFASLASWSELRHDTILYVKQSGTERGGMQSSNLIQGYVEPNPYLYARLASLSEFFITGLGANNLLYEVFDEHLINLKALLLSLKTIAEKELTNQPLSVEDYELINNIGQTIETIVEFAEYGSEGPMPGEELKMPVIADVHTDANSNTCLEEGVGFPFSIYVICNIEGELVITKGAGFSHYEFIQPITDRLTDEKWQHKLTSGGEPPLAYWAANFMEIDSTWTNNNPTSYYWEKQGLQKMYAAIEEDSINVGEQITVNIFTDPIMDGFDVDCKIVTPDETQTLSTVATDALGRAAYFWVPAIAGQHYVEVTSGELKYRKGFIVTYPINIKQQTLPIPTKFSVSQNFPNPFNAATKISYTLPEVSNVTINVYNMLGVKVRTLVNTKKSAGEFEVIWDGKNDRGKNVSSGVYFYKIIAGDFNLMRKMVLLY